MADYSPPPPPATPASYLSPFSGGMMPMTGWQQDQAIKAQQAGIDPGYHAALNYVQQDLSKPIQIGGDPVAAALGPGPGQGPVLQNGNPIPGASFDLSHPGAAESFFGANQGGYTAPGYGDAFTKAMMGQYGNGSNLPSTSNNAQGAYDAFKAGPTSAGLDPYYQNANRIADTGINNAMASRGLYGSSAADSQISASHTNLAADQANRTADFDLRRAQEGGALASNADQSSVANSANQRGWGTALGTLAASTDASDINRLNSGVNAASTAETQMQDRTQNAFSNKMAMADRLAAVLGGANTNAQTTDQTSQENAANLRLGQGADAANAAVAKAGSENASLDRAVNAGVGASKLTSSISDSLKKAPAPTPAAPAPYSATAAYQYPSSSSFNANAYRLENGT
jgi:hypothetical protein